MKTHIPTAAVVLAAVCLLTAPAIGSGQTFSSAGTRIAIPSNADDGAQDFVFLAEARPILIRVHARVNGKPVQAAWNDFMAHAFRHFDSNGDGFVTEKEFDRAPPISEILGNGSGSGIFRGFYGVGNVAFGSTSFKDIDTNKDGKISLAELSARFRALGFAPVQMQAGPQRNANDMYFMFARKTEPTNEIISDAIFNLLDVNRDGRLSKDELAAAPKLLLPLDVNEDEMLTTREMAPSYRAANPGGGMMMSFGPPGASNTLVAANKEIFLKVTPRGQAPGNLAECMLERYAAKGKKGSTTMIGDLVESMLLSSGLTKKQPAPKVTAKENVLSRADLGLDAATFALLDKNGDGRLDARELAGFVNRAPDVELVVRLGTPAAAEERVQVLARKGAPNSLAAKIETLGRLAMLDLGATRTEFRGSDSGKSNGSGDLGGFTRIQSLAQFKQVDKSGKGYLTESEAAFLGQSFKAMDRDGDGKLTEQEFVNYLDTMQDLQNRARDACVTLALSDMSRGLFDLLDVNRDNKLGVREMRGAAAMLEKYDTRGKGYLTRAELPRTYRLTLRRGPANASNPLGGLAVLYGIADNVEKEDEPTAGPAWFRKMDRNRDGDVSRGEWLGSEDLFRRIDTDGDGLISVQEAVRYDALQRKQK